MSLETDMMTILWRNGLIAIPIALAVVLLCRCVTLRPSTRHALWLLVLASFLMPPALHSWWNPVDWRASFAHAVNEPPQAHSHINVPTIDAPIRPVSPRPIPFAHETHVVLQDEAPRQSATSRDDKPIEADTEGLEPGEFMAAAPPTRADSSLLDRINNDHADSALDP